MRIAIFSDIHGNMQALDAILTDIQLKNIEKIISLGDTIGFGPMSNECIKMLIKNDVEMVLGNHEYYYLKGCSVDDELSEEQIKHHKWIKSLIDNESHEYISKCKMYLSYKNIMFVHFPLIDDVYPYDDLSKVKDKSIIESIKDIDFKYVFIGHEHKSFKMKKYNKLLFDVGSSGCSKDRWTYYHIISVIDDSVMISKVILKYDRSGLVKSINSIDYPMKDALARKYFGIRKKKK